MGASDRRYTGPVSGIATIDRLFANTLQFVERRVAEGRYDQILQGTSWDDAVRNLMKEVEMGTVSVDMEHLVASLGEEAFSMEEVRSLGGGYNISQSRTSQQPVVRWSFPIRGDLILARSALSDFLDIPTPNRVELIADSPDTASISFVLLLDPQQMHSASAEAMRREAIGNMEQLRDVIVTATVASAEFRGHLSSVVSQVLRDRFDLLKRRDLFIEWLNDPSLIR